MKEELKWQNSWDGSFTLCHKEQNKKIHKLQVINIEESSKRNAITDWLLNNNNFISSKNQKAKHLYNVSEFLLNKQTKKDSK